MVVYYVNIKIERWFWSLFTRTFFFKHAYLVCTYIYSWNKLKNIFKTYYTIRKCFNLFNFKSIEKYRFDSKHSFSEKYFQPMKKNYTFLSLLFKFSHFLTFFISYSDIPIKNIFPRIFIYKTQPFHKQFICYNL